MELTRGNYYYASKVQIGRRYADGETSRVGKQPLDASQPSWCASLLAFRQRPRVRIADHPEVGGAQRHEHGAQRARQALAERRGRGLQWQVPR